MIRTPLISRAEAGLLPPRRVTPNPYAEMLTLHYLGPSPWGGADQSSGAAFASTTDHARCATLWRGIQQYHYRPGTNAADVFYNSAACPHGYRLEGRGPGVLTGANGTVEGNRRSHAVLYLAGVGDPVTDAAMVAMHDEAAPERFGLPILRDHSRWKPTGCAGDHVRAWIAAGCPDPGALPPPPAPSPLVADRRRALLQEDPPMYALRDSTTNAVWTVANGKIDRLNDPLTFFSVPLDRLQHQCPMIEAPTMRWEVWRKFYDSDPALRPDQGGTPGHSF